MNILVPLVPTAFFVAYIISGILADKYQYEGSWWITLLLSIAIALFLWGGFFFSR
jgi:hypothetical protein